MSKLHDHALKQFASAQIVLDNVLNPPATGIAGSSKSMTVSNKAVW